MIKKILVYMYLMLISPVTIAFCPADPNFSTTILIKGRDKGYLRALVKHWGRLYNGVFRGKLI